MELRITQAEEQASLLLSEAKKKLSPKGFFQSLFGFYKNRTDDAIVCYQRAANLFKLSKNWAQAASSYQIAADLNVEHRNKSDAAKNYIAAARCLEKYDVGAAINCLLSAIRIYTDLGRFVQAAQLHDLIAKMCEDNMQLDNAVHHYDTAADYYKAEDSLSAAKRCLLKVAQYSAEFNDFARAVQIYEEIAFFDLRSPILQHTAKESLCKAVLCHLCVDVLNGKHAINTYLSKYPGFQISREFCFLKDIIQNLEELDEEGFTESVKKFDDIARLNNWYTKILLKIKRQMHEDPDLL